MWSLKHYVPMEPRLYKMDGIGRPEPFEPSSKTTSAVCRINPFIFNRDSLELAPKTGCRPIICQSEPAKGAVFIKQRLLRSVAVWRVKIINQCFIFFNLLLSYDC